MPNERDRPGQRRLQTATDRDAESARARRERQERTTPSEPVSLDFDRPITGVYSGEQLKEMRAERSIEDRLERGEIKQDDLGERVSKIEGVMVAFGGRMDRVETGMTDLSKRVGGVEVVVGDFGGQLKILPQLVDTMNRSIDALRTRDHVVVSAQVEVNKEQALDQIEANRDLRKDGFAERKAKRKRITMIVSGIVALMSSGAFLGWLFSR